MSANTVKIVYTGSLPDVAFEGGYAVRGEPVDVPLAMAERLCLQQSWSRYEAPKPEPKPKAKAADKPASKEKES